MSVPIKACLVIRAASGDEDAYEKLVRAMKYNIECGHYTSYPCDCNPRCDCTDEELEALSNFDPAKTAIIDERFRDDLKGFEATADSTAQIKLIEYAPNDLKYQSNAQKDGFAVFSEIYYPKGWNAYVDGKKTPHVRVNFVLRGMVIPAGKHMVEFKFEPKVFKVGEKISFASSLLLILVIVGYGVMAIRKYIKEEK